MTAVRIPFESVHPEVGSRRIYQKLLLIYSEHNAVINIIRIAISQIISIVEVNLA